MKSYSAGVIILSSIILSACGSAELDDLQKFTQNAYAGQKPKLEPLPEIRPNKGFTYTASNLVDPFSPRNLRPLANPSAKAGGRRPNSNRRKELLENFPLDSLTMVGTLTRGDKTWVIVRAPNGTVHHAKKGSYIGQNFGVITSISEEKIAIRELVQNLSGNWIERKAGLATTE